MVDSLLRLSYTATDAAAATTAVRAVLGSAEVTMRMAPFSWRQTSLVDDGISISRIHVSGDGVELRIPSATELIVVHVQHGAATLHGDDGHLELTAGGLGLVPIGTAARLRVAGADIDMISFPPAAMARLLGVPRQAVELHAPRRDPRTPELAQYFRQVARLLTASVFGVAEVYERDLVRTQTIDLLAAITVEAFELTNRTEEDTSRDITVLRRALNELRAHLSTPISIPDVAHAAGVSVRALQLVFQRQLNVTPLLHLRALRLEAARQALDEEATRGTTVAEIARRFGYANSGRFSTHYRDAFGESPAARLQVVRSRTPVPRPSDSEADVVQPS